MSWSGFKKNVGRATTQVMMKTGHVEKTSDREYEVEERRYRTLESASLRLQKEAKGYLDSLRAMTASQMRIAETIDAFYGDSGAKDGVSRSYKQAVEDLDAETVKALDGPYRDCTGFQRECELMEYLYRTTVLEPINRFCAYFPDINECIKKRQHKMLDYDALRSKVKKLTEKPDKDPSKLPRTEKETEMVSMKHFLDSSAPETSRTSYSSGSLDLSVPSPPKYLQRPEIEKLRAERDSSFGLTRSPSTASRGWSLKSLGLGLGAAPDEISLVRSASTSTANKIDSHRTPSFDDDSNSQSHLINTYTRSFHQAKSPHLQNQHPSTPSTRTLTPTPFFQPSELEDIMRPVREEFLQKQADKVAQAKAAYEQLNDQLTNELPQLIDLRVPYLDPTFEALVKIQLRFCAEAYSRMAQVQQYLDASTRDQYANGDLDARVEDVLGQIRELSIAGTV